MQPLIVRYERKAPGYSSGRAIVRIPLERSVEGLRQPIEEGRINEVVIVGPEACTGWRLSVNRPVRFIERATQSEQDAIEQQQAAFRILNPVRSFDMQIIERFGENLFRCKQALVEYRSKFTAFYTIRRVAGATGPEWASAGLLVP
jgi:hypothetical protein